MDFTTWLKDALEERMSKNDQWLYLCKGLIQEEVEEKGIPVDEVSLSFLEVQAEKQIQENGPFATGVAHRPFYRAIAHNLKECCDNGAQLPPLMLEDPLNLLSSQNSQRLEHIRIEFNSLKLPEDDQLADLKKFLFNFLTPEDWRIWLMMRTTAGSRDWTVMPPSLRECLIGFTTLYQKKTPKKTKKEHHHHVLTVGAKALSKHWHRDRQLGFWGDCSGSEATKNRHANNVLLNILTHAVWINLHSLPHNHIVYEVRQGQGYGARWTRELETPSSTWIFRGFLEPQMEDGHSLGWVH